MLMENRNTPYLIGGPEPHCQAHVPIYEAHGLQHSRRTRCAQKPMRKKLWGAKNPTSSNINDKEHCYYLLFFKMDIKKELHSIKVFIYSYIYLHAFQGIIKNATNVL